MLKVKYGKSIYYLDHSNNEIYDFKLEKLSNKDYAELKFEKKEFFHFLDQLIKKKNKLIFHTQESIREIVVENLTKDGIALNYAMTEGFLKGINYSIIKVNDITGTLVVLEKIKSKYNLSFSTCKFPLGSLKTDKTRKKMILKYISAPYGSHDKQDFETLPLLLPLVLSK